MTRENEPARPRTQHSKAVRHLVLLLTALHLAACDSTPEIRRVLSVTDADAVQVSFWSGASGQLLLMRNAGASVQAAAARTKPATENLRELDGSEMQKLLDALATYDFFQLASLPRSPRSKSALTVEFNGKQYVATGSQPDAANLQRWTNCVATYTQVFNRTGDFEFKELNPAERKRVMDDFQRHATEPADGGAVRKQDGAVKQPEIVK